MNKPIPLQTRFKVLMQSGYYVDAALLHKGVYLTDKPHLYRDDDTIESMIAEAAVYEANVAFDMKTYMTNLSMCRLVSVNLSLTD